MKWAFVVLALLGAGMPAMALQPSGACDDEAQPRQRNLTEWKFTNYTSKEYRQAVQSEFTSQRETKYKHLLEHQWRQLKQLVYDNADRFYIEGAEPTTVQNYRFGF